MTDAETGAAMKPVIPSISIKKQELLCVGKMPKADNKPSELSDSVCNHYISQPLAVVKGKELSVSYIKFTVCSIGGKTYLFGMYFFDEPLQWYHFITVNSVQGHIAKDVVYRLIFWVSISK